MVLKQSTLPLSVIIPFYNEKEEVENTIKSIKQTGGESLSIILVNDASDDSYDYKSISLKYSNITYIENPERKGSAYTKQRGIEKCQSPFFLVLDAHMRFYDNNWICKLIHALESNEQAVYCCRCKPWSCETKRELDIEAHYGAFLKIISQKEKLVLEPCWIKQDPFPDLNIMDIPCVLGACYAASKTYWEYLKGYEGLKHYGSEEAYISIKSWLLGDGCRLVKDVKIGHLFKKQFPYIIRMDEVLYNKILIINLLIPEDRRNSAYSVLQSQYGPEYIRAKRLFAENMNEISSLNQYIQIAQKYTFDHFEEINNPYRWI